MSSAKVTDTPEPSPETLTPPPPPPTEDVVGPEPADIQVALPTPPDAKVEPEPEVQPPKAGPPPRVDVKVTSRGGAVHVRGGATTGLAPRATGGLKVGESRLLTLTGGSPKAFPTRVRIKRRKDRFSVTVGAPEGTFREVRCGGGWRSTPASFALERRLSCDVRSPDASTSGFELRVASP